jgi:hypothetical protein
MQILDTIKHCPICSQPMKQVGDLHYHCPCGCCVLHTFQYQFFKRSEKKYCPEETDWRRDPYIKTSGLA